MNIKILNMLLEMTEVTDLLKEQYGITTFDAVLIEDCKEFYKLIIKREVVDTIITIPKDALIDYETRKTKKEINEING